VSIQFSGDWVFGLIGAGGFGREVMPIALDNIGRAIGGKTEGHVCFVETAPRSSTVNGIPCLSEDDFFALNCERKSFNIAVADSAVRQSFAERCLANDVEPYSLRSMSAEVFDSSDIHATAILCGYSSVTSNVRIGKFFHANVHSYVAHDCVIGDYVTFAPNVHCSGNVHVGDHAYIGAGALIKQGTAEKPLVIGEGAVIGMGAVVVKEVPPYTTVIGNPARPFGN
jgi:sugar O-acyltransferase (sialic acid O-acetyltransferase NeuD family)